MQQRDPFASADTFARMMMQAASQDNQSADNALMRMFMTEAGRQDPYADIHRQIAMPNLQAKYNPKPAGKPSRRSKKENPAAPTINGHRFVGSDGMTYEVKVTPDGQAVPIPVMPEQPQGK